jgi:type VI secretion system protein ImpF
MASISREVGIRPSLLDRLIDLEPGISAEPADWNYGSLDDLKRSVRRDLEWLLNTRRMVTGLTGELKELKKSVVTYGIPDISGVNIENRSESAGLTLAIEDAIRTFEPRFLDVSATMEPLSLTDRQIRLRIEARLDVEPVPEPMVFDTILQLGSGTISIKEASSETV